MMGKTHYIPNILIVTIDPDISNLIEVLLNNLNYKIQLINSGNEVIERVKEKDFDIILLDVNLPDMNVFQVISFARDTSPNTMIIVLSGESSFDKTIDCLNSGAYDYIRKPFNKEEILRRIENALGQKKLKKELEDINKKFEVSEQRNQYLLQHSHDIVYTLDYEGNFTFINDSMSQLLGYDSTQLLRKHYSTIVFPEDVEKARFSFNERRTINRGPQFIKLRLKTTGNENPKSTTLSYITVELKAKGVYDSSQEKDKLFLGTYGIARDISKLIEIKELCKLQKAYFQQLFNSSPEGIVILDNNDRIIDVNKSFEDLFKYSHDELKNNNIHNFIMPDDPADKIESLPKNALPMEGVQIETIRKRKDGNIVNVLVLGFPIIFDNKQIGIFGIYKDLAELRGSEKELEKTLEKLRKAMGGIVHAMVSTVEVRDPYTAGHQQRVASLARAISQELGLSTDEIEGIRMAGTLHDLGKVNIPAEILSKPGRLTDIEFNLIKMHPEIAYGILQKIDTPWPIAEIVYQHHERIDGSGYPRGLMGKDIPLAAKILTVADVVDAIASHRPYRPALGIKKALSEISENSGIIYEKKVVNACMKLFIEKRFSFEFENPIENSFFAPSNNSSLQDKLPSYNDVNPGNGKSAFYYAGT